MIHLDTSFLIRSLTRDSVESRALRAWLKEGTAIGMSSISWTEFRCGPVGEGDVELAKAIVEEPEPFLSQDADLAAKFFNLSGRRRGSLIDCMIAASAVRSDALLATSNPLDFRRLEEVGVRLAGL